ncbi:MAG: SRPBCC domain-containing protein [Actinomycetota bacterium]
MTDTPDSAPQPDSTSGGVGRSIELEIEVPGTPEEVWRAIATGPGVSSWYVRHRIEEREGGDVEFDFGPDMQATGRVAAWDPPRRVLIDGGDVEGLAFEWIVEARDGASCVVRLVNSGFGSGEEWDAQYDAMRDGWLIFLSNLRLHLTHFGGRSATPSLPMANWAGPRTMAWQRLLADLGLPEQPNAGDRIVVTADDAPPLAGMVADVAHDHLALVLDQPAEGTAFLAAEQVGDTVSVSVWSYLYGDEADALVERDEAQWRAWLAARSTDG